MSERLPANECLDYIDGDCSGPVIARASLGGTGALIPRCGHHYDVAYERAMGLRDDYPDSPAAPEWFDPMDAGESWDEDW